MIFQLGNLVALASFDSNQIESMKQPFIDSLFNLLDVCRKRQNQTEQTKTTSVWHPIIGHVKGKTSTMTV